MLEAFFIIFVESYFKFLCVLVCNVDMTIWLFGPEENNLCEDF